VFEPAFPTVKLYEHAPLLGHWALLAQVADDRPARIAR
jgi:hypothetical protein